MPGAVGEDEGAVGRGEVAVGDVDRDALLALGAQAVGEQRQVGVPSRPPAARPRPGLDGVELVGEHRLGVVQQPADEGGLAVVDRAGGGEAEEPAVAQRVGRGGVRGVRGSWCSSEVPLLLAVLHGRLGDAVVGAGGAALGERGGGDLAR